MRLDEDKLETLRRWGQGLRQAGGEEDAAAGRAILMLIEEIEQLQIELSHARQQSRRLTPVSSEEAVAGVEEPEEPEEPALTLHERLQRALRQDPEEAGSPMASDTKTTASAQSWIESLRRQK
ncbi:MAG TPA: hypothetical protein VGP69_17355 [Gaiellaceae bacterium]|jgi:hypothetical protein|nr:hypothetical protein [Gaiellaceae bacterium]